MTLMQTDLSEIVSPNLSTILYCFEDKILGETHLFTRGQKGDFGRLSCYNCYTFPVPRIKISPFCGTLLFAAFQIKVLFAKRN